MIARLIPNTLKWGLLVLLGSVLYLGCGPADECTKNSDCESKGKDYICKQTGNEPRKCVKKEPTCPDSCSDNIDCGECPDGKNYCINNKCTIRDQACPPSCSTDNDCAGCPDDKKYCDRGSCEKRPDCPQSCTNDNNCTNCTAGNNYCVNGKCSQKPQCPASCTSNADCAPCPAGQQTCVNGKCGQAPPQCPASCTSNADCASCPAGQQNCVNGSCGQAPPQCPASCTSNADCAPCPAGQQTCVNGKCGQAPPQCPASCTNDADCAPCPDGQKTCVNNKCGQAPPQCPASCTNNADCAPCPAGQQTCVNGTCGQAPPQCPASCTNNADCAPCPAGQQTCVNGKCGQAPPQCPASCTNNADCAPCPDGQKNCVNGKCGQAPPQCPASCTSNADCTFCPANQQTCINGKCDQAPQCPPACFSDADCFNCPADQKSCVNGKCGQAPPQCPASCVSDADCSPCPADQKTCINGRCSQAPQCPASCTTDTDCVPCPVGQKSCVNGKCGQSTSACQSDANCPSGQKCIGGTCYLPGAGQACDANNLCPTSPQHWCITIRSLNNSFCFQDCTSTPTICASNTADGRTECVPFAIDSQNNTISVCLGRANKGGTCNNFGDRKQSLCKTAQNPPLYCSTSGKCTEAVIQNNVGDTCNKQNDSTEPIRICNETKNLVCSEQTGKCILPDLAKEGEPCDYTGTALGKQVICDSSVNGLTCIRFDESGTNQRCHIICDPNKAGECQHKTGLSCWNVLSGGRGLCFDTTCNTDADCAYTDYECSSLSSGGKACFPPIPPGPKDLGQICGLPILTNACKKQFFCLKTNDETGYCAEDCTQGNTCTEYSNSQGTKIKPTCHTLSATSKICLFKCDQPNQICPDGLTCQDFTIGKLCAPPEPVGPKDFGALCSSPVSTNGCKADFFCLSLQSESQGYCSKDCSAPGSTCPTIGGIPSTCTQVDVNVSYCLFPCGQPGQNCPSGLQCRTLSGGVQLCLAPAP